MDRNPTPRTDHADRIARALRHIDGHLAGDLGLDALADVAALSRFHFSRVFRAETGEGVAEAVRRMRLNRAALLVVATRDPVPDIARRCGFGHPGSFERAFAAAFGATPLRLRQGGRMPPPLLPPEKGNYTMFPTDIRETGETVLAAAPHRGAYQDIGAAFGAMTGRLAAAGFPPGPGPFFGIYYDDPSETPVAALRSHAGQELPSGAAVPEGLDRVVLPAGRFLVCTCRGPYAKLPEAWAWTYAKALPEGGHALRDGAPFERYVTMVPGRPEDNVTEIWVPVA